MHKLLVFDLDGTLAAVGKGMPKKAIKILQELEKIGYQIAICSGKTTFYLCGFMRQIGLLNPILIGENGANIQFGIDLPPKKFHIYPYSKKARRQIGLAKTLIEDVVGGDVWIQPNLVGYTPFPKSEEEFEKIETVLDARKEELDEVIIYRHVDSFDITPKEINKYNGLRYLSELTGIKAEEMVAFGDGVNDIPMFGYVDYAIGIGNRLSKEADMCFDDIEEALAYVIENRI